VLDIPFLPAKWYRLGPRTVVDLIVLHTAEVGESSVAAESLMRRCHAGPVGADGKPRKVSWHYCVDNNSITQSVRELDIAFHAPGANHNGIGIELCGRARQTPEEWDDAYSLAVLSRAAQLSAGICRRWMLPISFVDAAGLRAKGRGITTHAAVTEAFGLSKHTDPGPHFPMAKFLDGVRAASAMVA
jgi:N-acetyl-anhydromuramyl-L-alanine amidase AmpD